MVTRLIQFVFRVISMTMMVAFLTSAAWAGVALSPPKAFWTSSYWDRYRKPERTWEGISASWSASEDHGAGTVYTVQWRNTVCPPDAAAVFTTLADLPSGVWYALSWNGTQSGDQWTPYVWLPDDGLVKGQSKASLKNAQGWIWLTIYSYLGWKGADEIQTEDTSYTFNEVDLKPFSRYAVRVRASDRLGHSAWTPPNYIETVGSFDPVMAEYVCRQPPARKLKDLFSTDNFR